MNGRQHVAQLIARELPDWQVLTAPRSLDAAPRTPTVQVWTSEVRRVERNGFSFLTWSVETWVLALPGPDPEAGEDRLDEALAAYLAAVDADPAATWDTATRGVLLDRLDGYRVVITLTLRIDKE